MIQKGVKNSLDVVVVLLPGLGEDQDVVQVDEDEPVEHVPNNIIYEALEDGKGVGKPEQHRHPDVFAPDGKHCTDPVTLWPAEELQKPRP